MVIKLYNDYEIPVLGLGTYSTISEKPWVEMVRYAIDVGYRHIDCSTIYHNEKMIGEAIAEKIALGDVERDDIFVTSKLWNNKHEKDLVVPTLKKTLANLGLQYLDLYLIHWPFSVPDVAGEFYPKDANNRLLTTDVDFKSTWKGMEDCVEKGLTRSIGLCNFNIDQIKELCRTARMKPAVLQIECHPYLSQVELVNYCKTAHIVVAACLPLGEKIPPMKGRSLLDDPVLYTLARKYKKKPAQVAIRYQIDRGITVIPKSKDIKSLEENFNVFDFSISEKDVLVLDCLNRDERYIELKGYSHHKYYPFQEEYLEQRETHIYESIHQP